MKLPGFVSIRRESVYSILARYYWLSGHYSCITFLEAFFGSRKVRIHPYLPSNIKKIAGILEQPYVELLQNHTLFPLFALCLDQPLLLRKAMLSLKGNTVISAHIPHFKLRFFTGHKFCPLCVQRDIEIVGCGVWYIHHQIPGISACAMHGCELLGISNQDMALDRSLFLPDRYKGVSYATDAEIRLANFASSTLWLLSKQRSQLLDPILLYRRELLNQGFMTIAGRLYLSDLVEAISEYWRGIEFGAPLGLPEALKDWSFLGPMLRNKTGFPTHVVKHLLLTGWLFEGDATSFVKAIRKASKQARVSRKYSLKKCSSLVSMPSSKHILDAGKIQNAIAVLKQACLDHPEWKRKDIKAKHSSAFFMVYHYNKLLLEQLLPPKVIPQPPGKDWEKEDNRIVDLILKLKAVEQMSLSQIDHAVDGKDFLRKSLVKLPKTRELLKQLGKLPESH